MTDELTNELLEALTNLQKALDKLDLGVQEAKEYISNESSESAPKQNE